MRIALVAVAVAVGSLAWIGGGMTERLQAPVVVAVGGVEQHAHPPAGPAPADPTPVDRPNGAVADTARAAAGPVRPTGWYRLAAAEFEVSAQLLEALHQVETSASGDACVANLEGSGATGPFQFKTATFAEYGVDGNQDGVVDICGFADSLFSAARYLRTSGADAEPTSAASRQALARYGTDVERVIALALAYQDRDRS